LPELLLVAGGRDIRRSRGSQSGRHQQHDGGNAHRLYPLRHAALRTSPGFPVGPPLAGCWGWSPRLAESESVVAHAVKKVTMTVRFTSKGRSRDWAAYQASCPRPGISQITSMGSSAPMAMLMETPNKAINCGHAPGKTCQNKIRQRPAPLACAVK